MKYMRLCGTDPFTFAVDTSFGANGCIGNTNGSIGTNSGQFNAPFDVAVSPDGSTISVSDSGNNQIQQFDTNGNFIAVFGSSGTNVGQFNSPEGLGYDTLGYLYIADTGNGRVALAMSSAVVGVTGANGSALGQFDAPQNLSVGRRGIYVADTANNRVQAFASLVRGAAPTSFASRVPLSSELGLASPASVAAVEDFLHEYVYIADTANNRVLLVNLPLDDPSPAWASLTNHLAAGDISGAMPYFSGLSSGRYQQAFLSIGTNNLVSITSQISSISPSVINENDAEYYFTKVVAGETVTFPIEFVRENGAWKIISY